MLYTSWGAKTTEIALRCDWASCDGAQSDGAQPATEHNDYATELKVRRSHATELKVRRSQNDY